MSQLTSSGAAVAGRSLETPSFVGPALHPAVARLLGGQRGMVDGALPPALFVAAAVAVAVAVVRRAVLTGSTVAVAS